MKAGTHRGALSAETDCRDGCDEAVRGRRPARPSECRLAPNLR